MRASAKHDPVDSAMLGGFVAAIDAHAAKHVRHDNDDDRPNNKPFRFAVAGKKILHSSRGVASHIRFVVVGGGSGRALIQCGQEGVALHNTYIMYTHTHIMEAAAHKRR